MNPAPLYLLAPLALFLVTLVLYRISPLRAVAAGHARWFILPAFTLFILLIVINGAADPALRSPAFHWLMPGFGFALYLFTRTGLTASVLPGWDNLSSRCTP